MSTTPNPANRPTRRARPELGQVPAPAKTPQQRGRMARDKGQSGELEVVGILRELTGHDVRRRVRQHGGDSDLEGLPGWCVEVKRHASTPPASIAAWWLQTITQASDAQALPVLFYRADRAGWRCVWPAALHLRDRPAITVSVLDTLSADPLTWWRMVSELTTTPRGGVKSLANAPRKPTA